MTKHYRRNKWAFANACTKLSGLFLAAQERQRKIELANAKLEAQRIKNARAALEAEQAELRNALTASQIALKELEIEKKRRDMGLDAPQFDPKDYD